MNFTWGDPAALAAIKTFHRHDDFVVIERPTGEKWSRMYTGKASDLDVSGPPSGQLSDIFFSVNGFKKLGWRRLASNVSYLNSVFADIDMRGATASEIYHAIANFKTLAAAGAWPQPSVVVYSGRGFWVHYLIRETDSHRSVPATVKALEDWGRLQVRFAELLVQNSFTLQNGFKVDPQARSLNQLTRVPNSLNGNAVPPTPVRYEISYGDDGRAITYTLADLARDLSVAPSASSPASRYHSYTQTPSSANRPAPSAVRTPNRKAGQTKVIANRERQFWLAVGMCGNQIREPQRNAFAFVLNAILYGDPARAKKVWKFCKETCRPAMRDSEITTVIKPAKYKITNGEIADRLNLTYMQRVRLDIDRRRTAPTPRHTNGRAFARLCRRHNVIRAALASYMLNGMKPATMRQIASSVRRAGLQVSDKTILRDLRAMDLGWACSAV